MAQHADAETVAESTTEPKTPEQIFHDHFNDILALQIARDAIHSQLKVADKALNGAIKKYAGAGGDDETLKEALKVMKKGPSATARRFVALNRMLAWMKVPEGHQFGLFDTGTSLGAQIETAQKRIIEEIGAPPAPAAETSVADQDPNAYLDRIEKDGYVAGINGLPASANACVDGSPPFLRWLKGWREGNDRFNFVAPSVSSHELCDATV